MSSVERRQPSQGLPSLESFKNMETRNGLCEIMETGMPSSLEWMAGATLSVIVLGATGDLAKRKLFPALFNLYSEGLIPKETIVYGFGRTVITTNQLRDQIKPFLIEGTAVEEFLGSVHYHSGSEYGSIQSMQEMVENIEEFEEKCEERPVNPLQIHHRLFYFALPSHLYAYAALAIQATALHKVTDSYAPGYKGFCRFILEKPLGRDGNSFRKLNKSLYKHLSEDQIYRIDHYLGMEMVQNLTVLRFTNIWLQTLWNRDHVQCVIITYKDSGDLAGRGGYFDNHGVIRDIIQNHLFQVLSLVAMDAPSKLRGPGSIEAIRNAKMKVLSSIEQIKEEDLIVGQFEDYVQEETVENKESLTPTFAAMRVFIKNSTWAGVPFILKAGMGLDNDKAEVRIQFKDSAVAATTFQDDDLCPRNELVMMMSPKESVYLKLNVKSPGLSTKPIQSELELNFGTSSSSLDDGCASCSDPYTRLLLDVCHGRQGHFVRNDEVARSWELLDPILKKLEDEKVKPIYYPKGSRGPPSADDWINEQSGYKRNAAYDYGNDNKGSTENGTETKFRYVFDYYRMCYVPIDAPIPEGQLCDVGVYGLGKPALNIASHGFQVCVGSRFQAEVGKSIVQAQGEGNLPLRGSLSPEHFLAQLKRPRIVILSGDDSEPTDETIKLLSENMEPGDIFIDCKNDWYTRSIHYMNILKQKSIQYLDVGVSCVASNDLSLMVGGSRETYSKTERILKAMDRNNLSHEQNGYCLGYVGTSGSGKYVKMVHDCLVYGEMQLIGEVYDIFKTLCDMPNTEIAKVFQSWNKRELNSIMMEHAAAILSCQGDIGTKCKVIDCLLDLSGTKDIMKWTIDDAINANVNASTIATALKLRQFREHFIRDAGIGLATPVLNDVNKEQVIDDVRAAFYCAKICMYAQYLDLIKISSIEYDWGVHLEDCTRLWANGRILQSKLLTGLIQDALKSKDDPTNIIQDPSIAAELNSRGKSWRRVLALTLTSGIVAPSLVGSLQYIDESRRVCH